MRSQITFNFKIPFPYKEQIKLNFPKSGTKVVVRRKPQFDGNGAESIRNLHFFQEKTACKSPPLHSRAIKRYYPSFQQTIRERWIPPLMQATPSEAEGLMTENGRRL
ncbi:hypothetical protein CEXT_73291 [Caerostris extrusa]|uniref:Uncharacterized protein n=1 Tax=Caerostris extrusa TaxID=172846 RepID=A0AAV4XHI9_CAEEX|nr:hypothetical protein CEXT_73291 [Caerostris extrusa]